MNVSKIRVPAGTKIYEGIAAQQEGLVGGEKQLFIPEVKEEWLNK